MNRPSSALAAEREGDVTREPSAEFTSDRKLQFLRNSDNYPERPTRVEVIETHYSWVFLTDRHAYKLKKPIKGDGFDFRSVEARGRNALAEWRLNRRLAPDVYLGIVPLMLSVRHQRL